LMLIRFASWQPALGEGGGRADWRGLDAVAQSPAKP
jgi:hypothetical protein